MRIVVNGASLEARAAALSEVLEELGYHDAVVSTAVNGEFVPVGVRGAITLHEGDRLEVLAPMQGG
jgi:sulfur carrier protein